MSEFKDERKDDATPTPFLCARRDCPYKKAIEDAKVRLERIESILRGG